jgi:hypothetical protein
MRYRPRGAPVTACGELPPGRFAFPCESRSPWPPPRRLIRAFCLPKLAFVKRSAAFVAAAAAVLLVSPAVAAPPVLVSVSHVDRHPEATWTLPPGVTSQAAEVATSPATSTDGYFFSENVKAFDILERAQTHWVYNFQLDPGTYYLHIAGLDEPCFFAGLCPVREFTQTATLVIAPPPPPPPPPPPRPRYEASVHSIHPGAVTPGATYLGDTVRVRFRNARARPADGQGYRVCYTHGRAGGSSAARGTRGGCGSHQRWPATAPAGFAATSISPGGLSDGSSLGSGSESSTTRDVG